LVPAIFRLLEASDSAYGMGVLDSVQTIFSTEELIEIAAYHDPKYLYGALDYLVFPTVSLLAIKYLLPPLYAWSLKIGSRTNAPILNRVFKGSDWATALIFVSLWFAFLSLVSLPAEVYFGFVHAKKFKLSTESFPSFCFDLLKEQVVYNLSLAALTFGLLGLVRRLKYWYLILGITASLAMLASALIDPYRSQLYFTQTSLPDGSLRTSLLALLQKAHVEVADIRVDALSEKTVRVQAYFAGTGPTRTVVLGDTLIAALNEKEIVAAVAHEAGHVGESKLIPKIASTLALLAFLGMVEFIFRRSKEKHWFGIEIHGDVRALPIVFFAFGMLSMFAEPITGYFSRRRETQADAFAVNLTQDVDSFQSMLVKAARVNKMDPNPPAWWVFLGTTHPPIAQRIQTAGTFLKQGQPGAH
jgi:STE24 endopeptidase